MAPEWAKAVRPLVLVFGLIAFLVTVLFEADVDAQAGAYATGVLVLMTSAAVAVAEAYREKLTSAIEVSHLPVHYEALFLEVIVDDSSDFETELQVRGVVRHGYRVLEVHGPVVPNTIASVLLHIRDVTGLMPHIYFRWTEGNPVVNLLRFLFLGEGEIAPVTREVRREAEPDVTRRPWVHVG
jgi:hypothetical protein